MGEHDGLHPVVQLEFGEDPADVGLHGGLGQHESVRDLRVRVAGRDLDQHLAFGG